MRSSIGKKLYLSLISTILVGWLCVVVAIGWVIKHETDEIFNSGLEEVSQRLLSLAIHELETESDEHKEASVSSTPSTHEEYLTYQLYNQSGQIISQSHQAPSASYGVPLSPGHYDIEGQHFYVETTTNGKHTLVVAERPSHRSDTLRKVLQYLLIPLVALLACVTAVIYWSVSSAQSSILKFGDDIAKRDSKDLSAIDTDKLPTELFPLGETVNSLLQRLKFSLQAERNFTANSAHELRTPLATALAQLDVLKAQLPDAASQSRVGIARDTIDRLEKMTIKLLQLAKAESSNGLGKSKMDLTQLVSMLTRDLSFRTTHAIHYTKPKHPVWILGDMDALGIAIQNLLENANKYAEEGVPLEIDVSEQACLTIRNDCIAIPPDILETLTNRFVRHNANTDGSGIGLSIVETILENSGAKLIFVSPCYGDGRGFMAQVSFGPDSSVMDARTVQPTANKQADRR